MAEQKDDQHRVTFFMDEDDFLRFKARVALEGETISGWLRDRIATYLEQDEDSSR